uniref:UBX domain-containing protein 11 n=1 Tax=Strix occidentalis caurina TaxID=311401 RepID=A0A8D0F3B4_STROC
MRNGPFRPYEEPSVQQCLQDIVDGYFPSELQLRYPDGVPLQVSSQRSSLVCGSVCSPAARSGFVHAKDIPKCEAPLPVGITLAAPRLCPLSRAHRLCHRQSARSSADEVFPTSRVKTAEEAEPSAPDVCTLRIKSESGEQTYVVKMLFTETIGDLRQYLTHARGGDSDSYEIISTFPQRVYADNSRSLQECGLIPNASLLLRRRDPSQRQGSSGAQAHSHAELPPSLPPPPPPSPACCSQELDAATGHRVIGEEHNPFAASQLNPE